MSVWHCRQNVKTTWTSHWVIFSITLPINTTVVVTRQKVCCVSAALRAARARRSFIRTTSYVRTSNLYFHSSVLLPGDARLSLCSSILAWGPLARHYIICSYVNAWWTAYRRPCLWPDSGHPDSYHYAKPAFTKCEILKFRWLWNRKLSSWNPGSSATPAP